jgi:hypothetical protein
LCYKPDLPMRTPLTKIDAHRPRTASSASICVDLRPIESICVDLPPIESIRVDLRPTLLSQQA